MADPFVISHIRRLPLFAQCTPDQLDALGGAFQMYRYAAGQPLYRQGERSQALFLFASGGGQLIQVRPDGSQQVTGQVQPGEYIGEASLFTGTPRDVTAISTQESIVLVLPRPALDTVLAARPDIRSVLAVRRDDRQVVQTQQERGVRSDEHVLLTTRRHPWTFLGKIIRALFLAALLIALSVFLGRLPAAGPFALGVCGVAVFLPALLTLYWLLDWRNDYFTVTSQRVIHEDRSVLTGTIRRDQVLVNAIQSVDLRRNSYLADLVGFGDILIDSPGRTQPLMLDKIPNPAGVQQTIFNQTQLNRRGAVPGTSVAPRTPRSETGGVFPKLVTVDGQRVIYHKHWLVLFRHIRRSLFGLVVLAMLLTLVGLFHRDLGPLASPGLVLIVTVVWLLAVMFGLLWGYLAWLGDVYIIDGEILIDVNRAPFGFREYRSQASLLQIQNVTSNIKSIIGRIFNYGDVMVQTASGTGNLSFSDVPNPQGVADEILRRMQLIENRRNGQ